MKCKECGNDPLDAFLGDTCPNCQRAEEWRQQELNTMRAFKRQSRRRTALLIFGCLCALVVAVSVVSKIQGAF